MKKLFLILAVLLCTVSAQAKSASAQADPASKPGDRQIFSVSADAEIFVKPDRVRLTFGVSERSKDLHAAKERMSETLKKAISLCKAIGIQDKHIQTAYISIYPDYVYDDNKARSLLRHYALTQSFTIILENPDKYETLLYTLLELGINDVENISFTTSELRKYRDEARLAAVRAAQEKAKLLTDAVGLKLGKVVNIQEGQRVSPAMPRSRNMMSQNVSDAPAQGDTGGEGFALGMISVKAEVTVSYELE
jgi:uncharacterized protein YggE